jgi:hypothetical protein
MFDLSSALRRDLAHGALLTGFPTVGILKAGMDRILQGFKDQTARFEDAPCDERSFCGLSEQAVALYEHHPEQGEALARLMTGVWSRNRLTWREGKEKVIGELFADLDVPPAHVVGGEKGAASKWATIKRLVEDT